MRLYCVCMGCGAWHPMKPGDLAGCHVCDKVAARDTPAPIDIDAMTSKYPACEQALRMVFRNILKYTKEGLMAASSSKLSAGCGYLAYNADVSLAISLMVREGFLAECFMVYGDSPGYLDGRWDSAEDIPDNLRVGGRVVKCFRWNHSAGKSEPSKPTSWYSRLFGG